MRSGILLDDAALENELALMTDWNTDRLAVDALRLSGVAGSVFINNLSRLVVDPERFSDESEPMAAVGMGAVYLSTSDRRPLRNRDPDRHRQLCDSWFFPYSEAFARLVDEVLETCGEVVIVDLHSYLSAPLPYELDPAALRPGVCIGTDAFHTPAVLADRVRDAFEGIAGGVGENTPFVGTYVPLGHLNCTRNVQSVIVEIRRDLYMTEPGEPLGGGYDELVQRLAGLFADEHQ